MRVAKPKNICLQDQSSKHLGNYGIEYVKRKATTKVRVPYERSWIFPQVKKEVLDHCCGENDNSTSKIKTGGRGAIIFTAIAD